MAINWNEFKNDWMEFDKKSLESCGYDFSVDEHDMLSKVKQSGENCLKIAQDCMTNGIDIGGIIKEVVMPRDLIKHDEFGWIFIFRAARQKKDRYMVARQVITHIAMQNSNRRGEK